MRFLAFSVVVQVRLAEEISPVIPSACCSFSEALCQLSINCHETSGLFLNLDEEKIGGID